MYAYSMPPPVLVPFAARSHFTCTLYLCKRFMWSCLTESDGPFYANGFTLPTSPIALMRFLMERDFKQLQHELEWDSDLTHIGNRLRIQVKSVSYCFALPIFKDRGRKAVTPLPPESFPFPVCVPQTDFNIRNMPVAQAAFVSARYTSRRSLLLWTDVAFSRRKMPACVISWGNLKR